MSITTAHDHPHCCAHNNLRYCQVCRLVYCLDCRKEWREGASAWIYQGQYPYTTTIGCGGLGNANPQLTTTNTCDHT